MEQIPKQRNYRSFNTRGDSHLRSVDLFFLFLSFRTDLEDGSASGVRWGGPSASCDDPREYHHGADHFAGLEPLASGFDLKPSISIKAGRVRLV